MAKAEKKAATLRLEGYGGVTNRAPPAPADPSEIEIRVMLEAGRPNLDFPHD